MNLFNLDYSEFKELSIHTFGKDPVTLEAYQEETKLHKKLPAPLLKKYKKLKATSRKNIK